jgi:hypothetical protein
VTTKLYGPVCDGEPLMVAVFAPVWVKPNPAGSPAGGFTNEYGAVPPEAVQVVVYATPWVVGPVAGLHESVRDVGAVPIVPENGAVAVCRGLEES